MDWLSLGLLGIFLGVFLSYSFLPISSELALIPATKLYHPISIFIIAFLAASIGSLINYFIGKHGIRKLLPKQKKLMKAEKIYAKYGILAVALLSWLPWIGDPIIIVSGMLRMPFLRFFLASSFSKFLYLGMLILIGISLL
ncbi:MAG: VTT domain-containing protein [Candidatus Pacearchaeota archaeon]